MQRHYTQKNLFVSCLLLFLFALLLTPAPALALRVVLISDTQAGKGPDNYGVNAKELAVAVETVLAMQPRPDMVFCLGDMVGAGFVENAGYQFEHWKKLMEPITQAGIALYVVKGNHELYRDQALQDKSAPVKLFFNNQQVYAKAFANMPDNGPKGYEHLAYTVTDKATSTVFTALDSLFIEQDMAKAPIAISEAQLDWLRGPLPAVDTAVHRIMLTHAPAFNPKKEQPRFISKSFQRLWKIMEEKRFDLMIAAHYHISSFALIDSAVYPASRHPITHVVIGPVGGNASKAFHSDPLIWNTRLGRNFLLLEIDGPKPEDPIKLTLYMKTSSDKYTPVFFKEVYSSQK